MSAQARIYHSVTEQGFPLAGTLGQCKNPEVLYRSISARKMGHSQGQICGGSVLAPWQQQGLAPVHFASDIQMLSSSDSLCLVSVSRRDTDRMFVLAQMRSPCNANYML